jgi:hypothetical protein
MASFSTKVAYCIFLIHFIHANVSTPQRQKNKPRNPISLQTKSKIQNNMKLTQN